MVKLNIVKALNMRLGASKIQWVDHLPSMLWAYKTTVETTTNETHFNLTFIEVIAPIEFILPSLRIELLDLELND